VIWFIRAPVGRLNLKLVQVRVEGVGVEPFFPVMCPLDLAIVFWLFFRLFRLSKGLYFPPVVWVMFCGYAVTVGISHLHNNFFLLFV